jgi:hypothetical protein
MYGPIVGLCNSDIEIETGGTSTPLYVVRSSCSRIPSKNDTIRRYLSVVKGTLSRDFRPLVFFLHKTYLLYSRLLIQWLEPYRL